MEKSTWYHETFEEPGEIRQRKIHTWILMLLTCSRAFFSPMKTWKKDTVRNQMPLRYEKLILYCTLLVKMKNINEEYKVENNVKTFIRNYYSYFITLFYTTSATYQLTVERALTLYTWPKFLLWKYRMRHSFVFLWQKIIW